MYSSLATRASPLAAHLRKRHAIPMHPVRASAGLYHQDTSISARLRSALRPYGWQFHSSSQIVDSQGEKIDPYNYTGDRWLWKDSENCESRAIYFDFDALCRKVIALCPGANSIVSCDKEERGLKRVFVFRTDNAKRIVASLPFVFSGPSRLMTGSEVATIKYLQARTSIPIPDILGWSDDASNAIGSEYIITEHATGVPLLQKQSSMSVAERMRVIKSICEKLKELVDLKFPAYGSLFFTDTPYIAASRIPLDHEFSIGPHCASTYWNCSDLYPKYYHRISPNQGPWSGLAAYGDALIDDGISRIPPDGTVSKLPRYHGSISTHLKLLEHGRAVIKKMAEHAPIQKAASPLLFHPSLQARNIFVSEDDPTVVTDFVGWNSCCIEPAFWDADQTPDFAHLSPYFDDENEFEPTSLACAKAYTFCTQAYLPRLHEIKQMDGMLFRPFRYCWRTWADGAVAFRDELIDISSCWEKLGLTGTCPYPTPTSEELDQHEKDIKIFEEVKYIDKWLPTLLNTSSNGQVPLENLELAQEANQEIFDQMLQSCLTGGDSVLDEDTLRKTWPFDLK